jgi:outer membrane protein
MGLAFFMPIVFRMFFIMRLSHIYFTLLLIIGFYKTAGSQTIADTAVQVLKLEDAIEIAMKNNLNVQRSNIIAETERVYWQQSKTNLLPDLNASYTHGINAGRSIDRVTNSYINQQFSFANPTVGSNLTIFNGFALLNTIKRNSLSYSAAKMEEQQSKDNLTLDVILTYLQVLTNQDLLELSVKQRETSRQQVERLEILNKNGAVPPGEYFDLKGQYANDQMAVVTALNNLENSKLSLTQLLNIPYKKNMRLEQFNADQFSLKYEASPEQIYDAALKSLALVKAADLRKQSADADIKVSRATFFPSVILNGGLSTNYSSTAFKETGKNYSDQISNNLGKSVSVGVAIPLFNSFRTKNALAIAKLNQKEADLTAKTTRIQLQQLTEQAYFNMTSSKDKYTTLVDQVNAFSASFRTAEVRFNAGAINSVDYLIAKNNLDRANLNLVASRYDFILRKKILDFYQGKPLK